MNIEEWENKIIDYIDGRLEAEDRTSLEHELEKRREVFQLYQQLKLVIEAMDRSKDVEPTVRLRASFEKALREAAGEKREAKVIFFQPVFFRAAAAVALVLTGVAIGLWITKTQQQNEEMLALRKEVEKTNAQIQSMLENENSASQRLLGVNVALQMEKPGDEVVRALVKAMNEDPNSNVRLAALDALGKFHTEPAVRTAIIKSLSTQKDPIVQIALIQLLVRMKEKGVVKELERMVEDEQNIKAVKDEAYHGILRLS
jgi:HEAT repeat protein